MKPAERDALLIRLDEKSNNIYTLTEKQEAHLSKLNDSMLKHATQISRNENSIKWIIRGIWIAVILGGGIAGIVKLFT